MITVSSFSRILDTVGIPYITAGEAHKLMDTELKRFLSLVDQLGPGDWEKPTACTEWNVRDMLAHQAGGYASGTGYKENIRQYMRKPKPGQLPEDAVNDFQLQERADKTPAELIAELRRVGPLAIDKWAYQFRLAKLITIPHPVSGKFSLRHLMWVIHSRDTWMHRLDICRATGREFEQTPEHDGRIAALVMRDVADTLARKNQGSAILFDLAGVAGGTWKVGHGRTVATVRMDVLDFNIFASGRYTYEQARSLMTIDGDVSMAEQALKHILVLY